MAPAERFDFNLFELEKMALLLGATWDGEVVGSHRNWLPYIVEKSERARRAANALAEIATMVSHGAPPLGTAAGETHEFSVEAEGEPALPYARRHGRAACPFCGDSGAKPSWTDRPATDTTRLVLYCDNSRCDVREFEVIVRRDGRPGWRADIAALDVLDDEGRDAAERINT